VIGKTGRMAMMRTVDPKIFIGSQALTAVVTRMQKELVSQMLADDMVLSKIDDAIASTL
jgi:hypothetical protein